MQLNEFIVGNVAWRVCVCVCVVNGRRTFTSCPKMLTLALISAATRLQLQLEQLIKAQEEQEAAAIEGAYEAGRGHSLLLHNL